MRTAYIIGYLAGVAIQVGRAVTDDRIRLRAENRSLTREVHRIAKLADNLRVDLSRAEAMLLHPSHRGAVENADIVAAARAVLADSVDDAIARTLREGL